MPDKIEPLEILDDEREKAKDPRTFVTAKSAVEIVDKINEVIEALNKLIEER